MMDFLSKNRDAMTTLLDVVPSIHVVGLERVEQEERRHDTNTCLVKGAKVFEDLTIHDSLGMFYLSR